MKEILIVNNNMEAGGIQKSLINFLKSESSKYHISLLLFSKSGTMLEQVPSNVRVLTPSVKYRILGLSKEQLKKHPVLLLIKLFHIFLCRVFSKRFSLKVLGIFQKKYRNFDAVISYSHLTNNKTFSNCCGEFVLDKTISDNKICLIHCDYENSNTFSQENNKKYAEFDKIACCSESVRKKFVEFSQLNASKVYVLRNFFDLDLASLSRGEICDFGKNRINILIVSRLSYEKGVDIAIASLSSSGRKDIQLIILGSGPEEKSLKLLSSRNRLEKQVVFLGEKINPYPYMANADFLLVPSRHEAAPLVFDEASVLNLPIISSNTTSAIEMLNDKDIIYYQSDELVEIFRKLKKRHNIEGLGIKNNKLQERQFSRLIDVEV